MSDFNEADLARMRACGVVIFAGRVIYGAQPPVDAGRLAEVRARCAGELPGDLLELWSLTAGGCLDYSLTVEMAGHQEAISWTELFYHGSDCYNDLPGWMDHEQELAPGPLRYLPIGGFEYCDRVYVCVDAQSPAYGEAVVWKMGLPPGWQHALHKDAVATIGANLKEAFARLWVDERADELETFLDESDLEPELIERVREFYRRARPDWRGALQRGELVARPEWLLLALNHALEHDEASLLSQLAQLGVDWSRPVRGGALAGEVALLHRSSAALQLLLELGAPFSAAAFRSVQGDLSESAARRMLELGARADAQGLVRCWTVGALEAARVLAEQVVDYEPERQKVLGRLREDLEKVRSKRMGHYLGEKGLQEQIDRLSVDLAAV